MCTTVNFFEKDSDNGKQLIDLDTIAYKKICNVDCNYSLVLSNQKQFHFIVNMPMKHRNYNDKHIGSNIGKMRFFGRIFLE